MLPWFSMENNISTVHGLPVNVSSVSIYICLFKETHNNKRIQMQSVVCRGYLVHPSYRLRFTLLCLFTNQFITNWLYAFISCFIFGQECKILQGLLITIISITLYHTSFYYCRQVIFVPQRPHKQFFSRISHLLFESQWCVRRFSVIVFIYPVTGYPFPLYLSVISIIAFLNVKHQNIITTIWLFSF